MSLPFGTAVEFTVAKTELKRELPPKDGKPAKAIVKLGLIAPDGERGWAESFEDAARQTWPQPGSKHTYTLEAPKNPGWLPSAKRPSRGFKGGRSPADTAAIQRQHSQEMGLRALAILYPKGLPEVWEGDGGGGPMVKTSTAAEQFSEAITYWTNFFEADIANGGKAK